MRFNKITLVIKLASFGYHAWKQHKDDETAISVFGKKIIEDQISEYNMVLELMGVEPVPVTAEEIIEMMKGASAQIRKKVDSLSRPEQLLDLL